MKMGVKIADSGFSRWICGDGAVIAKLRYGAQAVVFASDYIGRSMYLWGEYDPRISTVISAVLRNGDTALDIGANFGVTGLLAAKCIGPTGRLHLFEPQPLVASCLRVSLLINGYSNAIVHECALSDHDGVSTMMIRDPSNLGMASLEPEEQLSLEAKRTFNVQTRNARDYIAALNCSKAMLIKIDVEGHETTVLGAMREWLSEVKPPVILFECHLDGNYFEKAEPVRILSELGYEFFRFDQRPYWRTRLYRVKPRTCPSGYDFVAVHWSKLDDDRRSALESLIGRDA